MDVEMIKEYAGYVAAIITFLLGINKNRILTALNIKGKKKEIESSTADILDKNLEAYQKMFDGYVQRKEAEDQKQIGRINSLEEKVGEMEVERIRLKKEKEKKEWEVIKLREEIHEIKVMLDKALKQLEFYKKNSDIELPEELQ